MGGPTYKIRSHAMNGRSGGEAVGIMEDVVACFLWPRILFFFGFLWPRTLVFCVRFLACVDSKGLIILVMLSSKGRRAACQW